MTKREFEIGGYIGGYTGSAEYVRYMLDSLGEGPVTVKVTSYGGDVNHALKIKNIFSEHGGVTVEYVAYSASAATILGHGAKKTLIHEDGFYLIHKPSLWVDTWGHMNEDELSRAVEEVKTKKKDAETVTLVLAQDYVKCRNMEIKTVMELMKEARWLSGKEAVELGLVDELLPAAGKKPAVTDTDRAVMAAAGLPVPGIAKEPEPESVGKMLRNELKKFFSTNNNNVQQTMDKKYLFVNVVLGVEGLEVADGKITLTVEQILAIDSKLKADGEAVTAAETDKVTAEAAKKTAEDALSDVMNRIDTIDPTVKAAADAAAKVTAIQAKLAGRPGTKPEAPQGNSGKNDISKNDADWDTIDKLPHNRTVDETESAFS